jgi:hypothetical protein
VCAWNGGISTAKSLISGRLTLAITLSSPQHTITHHHQHYDYTTIAVSHVPGFLHFPDYRSFRFLSASALALVSATVISNRVGLTSLVFRRFAY